MPSTTSLATIARQNLARALDQGNDSEVEALIMQHPWPLYNQHYDLLRTAIASLPSESLSANPLLKILHPVTSVLSHTSRPLIPILDSDVESRLSDEHIGFLLATQLVAARTSGDAKAALQLAQELHNRINSGRLGSLEHPDGPLWYFYLQIGSTYVAFGDTARGLIELAAASQLAALSEFTDPTRFAQARSALAHAVRGSIGDAQRLIEASRALPEPTAAHVRGITATERTVDAMLQVEQMSPQAAHLLDLLEPSDSNQTTWPFVLLARARYFIATRQHDFALEAVQLSEQSHPAHDSSFITDIFESTRIDALIASGKTLEATRRAGRSTRPGPMTQLALVRLSLHTGDLESATQLLQQAFGSVRAGISHRVEISMMDAWVGFAGSGTLSTAARDQLLQYGSTPLNRRLFTHLPTQLIEAVTESASPDEREVFTQNLAGIRYRDVAARPRLTQSELRVLEALSLGDTTNDIAESLFVSPNTVKSHLQALYRKLDCSGRHAAVTQAVRLGLLTHLDPDFLNPSAQQPLDQQPS